MRKATAFLFAMLVCLGPSLAQGKEYFVNKGVKYHVGDSRASRSVDAIFMETFPVVGKVWVQRFTVDQNDIVHVRIDHLWGIDDCPYCKIIVSIDDKDLGRVFEENNRKPFTTPDPLAVRVVPGRTYVIKIESFGDATGTDDFVFENLVVETYRAEVKLFGNVLIDPPIPLPDPEPLPPVVEGTCEGSRALQGWLPKGSAGKGVLQMASVDSFDESDLGVKIAAGDYVQASLRIPKVEPGDLVGQAMEVLLGGEGGTGWVLTFEPETGRLNHVNLKRNGIYRAERFSAPSFKAGGWNYFRVARCPDGRASLYINGREVGREIAGLGLSEPIKLRVRKLSAELALKPY